MQIVSLDRAFYKLARRDIPDLSLEAAARLRQVKAFEQLQQEGISGCRAAEILGPSRATLYRWQRRLRRHGPRGLEPRSRKPRSVRQPTWSHELIGRVEALRREHPYWGKGQLTALLAREGFAVSESTVGRILTHLMRRGAVVPVHRLRARHRRSRQTRRFYAQRLPKGIAKPTRPGERIQIDPLHVSPQPGTTVKHFSAICPVSRWAFAEVYSAATAHNARRFLEQLLAEAPFPLDSIQVDGGSEFMADFEAACRDLHIPLYVLPPRSPKLNAHVERLQDTWRAEFYEIVDLPTRLDDLRPLVKTRQHFYNHRRPHSGLDKRTPAEYLQLHAPEGAPVSDVLN